MCQAYKAAERQKTDKLQITILNPYFLVPCGNPINMRHSFTNATLDFGLDSKRRQLLFLVVGVLLLFPKTWI